MCTFKSTIAQIKLHHLPSSHCHHIPWICIQRSTNPNACQWRAQLVDIVISGIGLQRILKEIQYLMWILLLSLLTTFWRTPGGRANSFNWSWAQHWNTLRLGQNYCSRIPWHTIKDRSWSNGDWLPRRLCHPWCIHCAPRRCKRRH